MTSLLANQYSLNGSGSPKSPISIVWVLVLVTVICQDR